MIKERVEQEKEKTKHLLYKLTDLLSLDLFVLGRDDEMYEIASTILEKCYTEEEYEVADSMLYALTRKHIVEYMGDIETADKYGIYWILMHQQIFERAVKLGICDESDGTVSEQIEMAMKAFCMDADEWLDASDEDFSNDLLGIIKNFPDGYTSFDFVDYRKFNGFIPKFSRHTALKYYSAKFSSEYGNVLCWDYLLNGTPDAVKKVAIATRLIIKNKFNGPYIIKECSLDEFIKMYNV